ncbi:uncharacterized protein LOC129725778 [Wyeomyia smithii]|uniref:uncharacterized protein LOC129725778 n=1 Tax=Wyeomyia smithii TaxID=174621 RepID=UPI002467BD83|nr:uncharacterized protein LOC129725778 [Wyeomyia smithii]
MKRSLLKIIEGEGVPSVEALQTFLQVYRSTSSATLAGKSPAEEMLGRSMRTTLDLLRPPVLRSTSEKHVSKYTAGCAVYAKLYSNAEKWKWIPGTVIEAIGGVNYNILLDNQSGRRKLIRSHVNQLRPRFNETVKPLSTPTPLEILVDEFQPKQPTIQQTTDNQSDSSVSDEFYEAEADLAESSQTLQPAEVHIPRPTRTRHLPKRLEDYIVG